MSTTRINDSDLASVALYDKVNAIANEFDAEVVKLTGDQTIGGTKSFTGGATFSDKIKVSNYDGSLELSPSTSTATGGIIDFHYAGSTADYTSRIVETASGQLSYVGSENFTATNSTTSGVIATKGWVNNPTTATNVVHRTGDQTISGNKTFDNIIKAKSGFDVINTNAVKGTNPTSTVYWGLFRANDGSGASAWRDTRLGIGEVSLQANGNTALLLGVYKNEAGSSSNSAIQIVHEIGGNKYATCPTPAISDNSTKIATTNWFNQKIQVVSTLPASPNSNVYYFVTG